MSNKGKLNNQGSTTVFWQALTKTIDSKYEAANAAASIIVRMNDE
jgi:hypothetical protein